MTPLQRTYAIAREATDAQQDVIKEMREQIEELREECTDLMEAMRHMIHLDDPVVAGLVDVLVLVESHGRNHGSDPLTGEACGCESCENYFAINKALSAYEARVKSIWPTLQNHGHMDIDYKYNNETTTMSPARVKEVGK